MKSHLRSLAFLAGLTAIALSGLATAATAQPAPSGPLFRVDPDVPLYYQDLAVDAGPGGFAVAWAEGSLDAEGNSSYSLRARRFDAAGGRLGPAVTLATSQDSEVDVAVDRNGGALAVWIDLGVRGRRLDSAGRPLGKPWLLDGGTALFSLRAVAHPEGGFLVAWMRGQDVIARRISANGLLGPETHLRPSRRGCGSLNLAIGPRGHVALVCYAGKTLLQVLDPDLKPRGGTVEVPITPPWTQLGETVVVFTTSNQIAAVWGASSEEGGFQSAILTQRYDLKRGWIGSPLEIEPQREGFNPVLAADPAGGLLVLWSNFGLYGRRIEASGLLGPIFTVDPEGLTERFGNLSAVAALEGGSFVAAWETGYGILGQRFVSRSPGQIGLRRGRFVTPEDGGQILLDVVRREGSQGEVGVSWSVLGQNAMPGEDFEEISGTVTFADGDSQPKRIAIPLENDDQPEGDEFFQVVLQDPEGGATLGGLAVARVEIRDDDTPSPLLAGAGPAIQVGGIEPVDNFGFSCCLDLVELSSGRLVAAWQLGFEGPETKFALFDAADQPVGAGQASGSPVQAAPQLLAQPDGGFILIARSDHEIPEAQGWFAQKFDAGGNPQSQQVPLESFRSMEALHITPAPGGGFFALGRRRDGTRVDLFVERYGADSRRIGEPVPVTERPLFDVSTLLEEDQLDIAASPSGALLVVWPRIPAPGRPGGVFARLVSASGVPLGNEIRIASAVHLIGRLTVAAAPDGGYVVAWESGRDASGWGISARWLDASGTLLGEEMTVNSTTRGNQTRPSAAFAPDGKLLIAWKSTTQLRGQLFAGPGRREASELTIAETTPGRIPLDSALVATGPGEWHVFWHWVQDDVTQEGFYIRRLARPGQ